MLGVDGIADFNALQSRRHDEKVWLYVFDILTLDGEDLRALPLSMRKQNLAQLLARRPDGIFVVPFEQGEIGPDLIRAACNMGLEGMVSKRADRPYRAGRCPHWIKVKTVSTRRCIASKTLSHRRATISFSRAPPPSFKSLGHAPSRKGHLQIRRSASGQVWFGALA